MTEKVPRYMEYLLDELGWNKGTRIPLANAENQVLENALITRQNEIQKLKEALSHQNQKAEDLKNYKDNVQTEYQENTRLLFALKNQLEQEVKIHQLAFSDLESIERSTQSTVKKQKEISSRIDRFQASTGKLLKRADELKSEVCGERGALMEWHGVIERAADDITAIEQFTKQDLSVAKELEYKRQKLQVEHDRMSDKLNQVVADLSAEERACERLSAQVLEGMEQRKQTMKIWTTAVENLGQRDDDIRHMREDYAVLEKECTDLVEKSREQQAFYEQQRGNNLEALKKAEDMSTKLSQMRIGYTQLLDQNLGLHSEIKSLQRVVGNMQNQLEKLYAENKRIIEERHRKDLALEVMAQKIQELRAKVEESLDKSKTAESRAKQLEAMLNEEERYASQLTASEQRAMQCSFSEQQKLIALINEEKLFKMQLKASRALVSKLEAKRWDFENKLQMQKEALYIISYQVETLGAKVSHMEGSAGERDSEELNIKEERLKEVYAIHASRVALLEQHSANLHDDMRRYARDSEVKGQLHTTLKSRLKAAMLNVEGGEKEVRKERETWRAERVEEALTRLRVAHATRAVSGYQDTAFTLDKQRLQFNAAMNERLVEISARHDMFNVQRNALLEDCSKLRCDIRERQMRIDQLIKRYDIFINSLGRDDSGQQLSVAFFKIKFAAERAELRERGAALDAEIGRYEAEVSALEATVKVVQAAHNHFLHFVTPLEDDSDEVKLLQELNQKYENMIEELKVLRKSVAENEERVEQLNSRVTLIRDKYKQLASREADAENELEAAKDRNARQEVRLNNAKDIVRHNTKRAKKLIEGDDDWRLFQMALWTRDYAEAAHNGLNAIYNLSCKCPEIRDHFSALLASTDLVRYMTGHQRRLQIFVKRILSEHVPGGKSSAVSLDYQDSLFSTSESSDASVVSNASAYTRRLIGFRKGLSTKIEESVLTTEIPSTARRSSVSLKVVTLGIEQSLSVGSTSTPSYRRRIIDRK